MRIVLKGYVLYVEDGSHQKILAILMDRKDGVTIGQALSEKLKIEFRQIDSDPPTDPV